MNKTKSTKNSPLAPLIEGGTNAQKVPLSEGDLGGACTKHLLKPSRRLPYNQKLKEIAKDLRKNMTKAEKKLWYEFLSSHKKRFLKQRPIDNYIVDFYCASCKLVIEIDGDTHFTKEGIEYDKERTAVLQGYGLKVVRFTNPEVLESFDAVCEIIDKNIEKNLNDNSPLAPLVEGGTNAQKVPLSEGDLWGACTNSINKTT